MRPIPSRRLVIIGLDAADHDVVRALMAAGGLPNLSRVAERGFFTRLGSTVPAQTAPAWTSITTGVNPGRHGIYYFQNFSTSPITITNATNTATPRIWDYVGGVGARSVVVNVPITYPAQEVKGSMVAGIPPWYFDERSVWPASLLPELKRRGYETDAPVSRALEADPEAMARRMVATEERRVRLFLDMLGEGDWLFGMVVITALDRLQHKAVGKGEREEKAVRLGYTEVDRLVGVVMDALGGEANFVVVSDHGYNARPLAFYPNAWLYERGLLHRRSSLRNRLVMLAHDLFDGHLLWLPQGMTKRFQGAATVVHTIDAVDLERSRAFVPGTDGVMVVRSKVDEGAIASGLSALADGSGRAVCRVLTRDEVYRGDRVGEAPQLLLIPRDDVNIKTDPFSRSVLSPSGSFAKGNHSPNGILLGAGPDIARAEGVQARIEDVAPTALALMGIRVPDSVEGRPLEAVLASPQGSRVGEEASVVTEARVHTFSEKEEKQVLEKLKRLGYA
ncbi:MAG: alkaline phosphatase family protein [Nitrososphaerota archaeon]|nr:alkaline phosphatase family protein [Nitrososphaerota archaeon]MDG6978475.1 alkaline phosphatase family protein [Nitrososphaerota archaeon]